MNPRNVFASGNAGKLGQLAICYAVVGWLVI
jgi:hypothetical protein